MPLAACTIDIAEAKTARTVAAREDHEMGYACSAVEQPAWNVYRREMPRDHRVTRSGIQQRIFPELGRIVSFRRLRLRTPTSAATKRR